MAKALGLWKFLPQLLWLPQNYWYAFSKALPQGSVLSVTTPHSPRFLCKPGGEGLEYSLPVLCWRGGRVGVHPWRAECTDG